MEWTTIARRDLTDRDVQIEILFCGICHSDLHQARNDWNSTVFPVVPGHEIVGRVSRIGAAVTKYQAGDLVAVGCLVDSDGTCAECQAGLEQFCPKQTIVFGSPDKHLGGVTYGGFSESIVVDEHFVLRVPPNLDPAAAAPLLCAGITTYSPMIVGRRNVSGSNIGGIAETQEMLDFCGAQSITADVEIIPIQKVNEAFERLLRSDVRYRFTIDMKSLK